MDFNTLLEKNVMRWRHFAPEVALQFLNLPEEQRQLPSYDDLSGWFQELDLKGKKVLYVYGLAFGEVYKAAKKWLHQDKNHLLVLFEDDVYQLREFFKTALADELLRHPHVYLYPLLDCHQMLHKQTDLFISLPYHIDAIPGYQTGKGAIFQLFRSQLESYLDVSYRLLGEFLSLGTFFFINYFQNLRLLPHAFWGNKLFGKMAGVPAIICGAGPSLVENIPHLEALKDKALIIGGGTSMNALNAKGFQPHLGAGIDPHIDQYYRVLANAAYEVPYLYRNRMNPVALKAVHGDKLFINGAGGYLFPSWIEQMLGIEGYAPEEGHSVVGFSAAIAAAMGCNPLIFVGMDLAYTGSQSYSEGILNHPIHQKRHFFRTKNEYENLIARQDIHGKEIYTTGKWILESLWFNQFAMRNPGTLLLNCTGGGIGFPEIINIPLKDVAESLKLKPQDIEGRLFSSIAEAEFPASVSDGAIDGKMNELRRELNEGIASLKSIVKLIEKEKEAGKEIEDFEKKPLYIHFLIDFERAHSAMYKRELFRFEIDKKDPKRQQEILKEHYKFLQKVCVNMLEVLDKIPWEKPDYQPAPPPAAPQAHYRQSGGRLQVDDPVSALKLDVAISATPEGIFTGLSLINGEEGQLLSQTCYLEGKKIGHCYRYYRDGSLAALLHYREGALDGPQSYYYRNGRLRSRLHYKNGLYHGMQELYHPNGALACKLSFEEGLREGEEQRWNAAGALFVEAHYQKNLPVGIAKEWYDDGVLKTEVYYTGENQKCCKVKQYDSDGNLLSEEDLDKDDFFDNFARKITLLTKNLRDIQLQVAAMLLEASKTLGFDDKSRGDLKARLKQIAEELAHLEQLNDKILEAVGLESYSAEPIWKSPQARVALEEQYSKVAEELQAGVDSIKEAFYELVEKMAEQGK